MLLSTIAGFATWAYSPYPADAEAVREVLARDDIAVTATAHLMVIESVAHEGPLTGQALLFLPGARVEPHAYAATFADLVVESGLTVVIPRPVANLALIDQRGVEQFARLSPQPITVVGGHSLGGVKACQLATDPQIHSLILFASYCVNDLSQANVAVLTLLASRDELTDIDAVNQSMSFLPDSATKVTIDGANHASFADYGPQSGDGNATLSRKQVNEEITSHLIRLLTPAGTQTP